MKRISLSCVQVDNDDLDSFARQWPCSGLWTAINAGLGVTFDFDSRGDLVDIMWFDADDKPVSEPESVDGSALLALSEDAQEFVNRPLTPPTPSTTRPVDGYLQIFPERGEPFWINKEQTKALERKFAQCSDGAKDFAEFARRASTSFGTLMLPWCGMWLGIETDGYTHS